MSINLPKGSYVGSQQNCQLEEPRCRFRLAAYHRTWVWGGRWKYVENQQSEPLHLSAAK